MSKHQSCIWCGATFVGPDSEIGTNLCGPCDESLHGDCKAEIERLRAELRVEHDIMIEKQADADSLAAEVERLRTERDALAYANRVLVDRQAKREQADEATAEIELDQLIAEIKRLRAALREIIKHNETAADGVMHKSWRITSC